jgi:hypothetical protein
MTAAIRGACLGRRFGYISRRSGSANAEAQMTAIDPELERHRRSWIGFTWFIRISLLVVVIILIGMALFLL